MTEIPDNNTLQTWVNELKTYPNFINDLDPSAHQCDKLLAYLNKLRDQADSEADTARYILNEWKDPVKRPDMVGNIEAINRQRLLMLNYIKDSMIYSNIKTIVEDWKNKQAPTAKDQEPAYNTLLDAFKDVSEYKRVLAILQSKRYITADYIWQDQKKGWMTTIVSIIKLFAVKGYCKKTKFDPAEIQAICINTFQTESISISTIKHAKPNDISINFD
jgi:hypothetical protein